MSYLSILITAIRYLVLRQLAKACYLERIDLSAHGFYKTPDIDFDWKTGKGKPFKYFTYGAAFSEVEIDTLTGDFHTRKADMILDLGFSLNPAIDIGQVGFGIVFFIISKSPFCKFHDLKSHFSYQGPKLTFPDEFIMQL